MKKALNKGYTGFIAEIKQNIIRSRYQAARVANRELLLLYLQIGKRLSEKIQTEKWGAKVLQQLADDLQKELPGLRGFSYRNLMKMRQFTEEYIHFLILPSVTAERKKPIRQSGTAQIGKVYKGLVFSEKEMKGILPDADKLRKLI